MIKKFIFTAIAVVTCASYVFSQSATSGQLTKQEREKAMAYLKETRDNFLDSIKGLSEEQWNFKPAPDRWSVAEVAEHIGIAEQTLFAMVTGMVLKSPPDPSKREAAKGKEDQIIRTIPNRTTKAQAPEILKPIGRWKTRDALTEEFKKSRGAVVELIQNSNEPLRDHFGPNPVFQELDAYQWIFFIAAHTARHTAQILEVKADAGFPKKKRGY